MTYQYYNISKISSGHVCKACTLWEFCLHTVRAKICPGGIYDAAVLTRLKYSLPAWRGFIVAKDHQKLEAFIHCSIRVDFCSPYHSSFETMCHLADKHMFDKNPVKSRSCFTQSPSTRCNCFSELLSQTASSWQASPRSFVASYGQ